MSLRSCKLFLALLFTMCFSAVPLVRADFPPIPKEEMALKDVPEQPGAPAVVLFREQIDDDDKHMMTVYVRMKVLTEAGRRYADVDIPYPKGSYSMLVEEVRGRTTHADGTQLKWEGNLLDKLIVKNKDWKYNAKVFALPDVQPGSIIEYSYVVRRDPGYYVTPHWMLQDEIFQRKIHYRYTPTEKLLLVNADDVTHGASWAGRLPKGATVKNIGGVTHGANSLPQSFDLVMTNVAPFVQEELMPPKDFLRYHVNFYYVLHDDPAKFWPSQGKRWSKNLETFLGKTGGIDAALAKIVAPGDTAEQKVRKIYAYINTLENISYRPERSESEEKTLGIKRSESVEDVLAKQSGNRDELARLFVAMVRATGTPALLMMVADRNEHIFEPEFLEWRQLDDEIAIVTLNGKEVLLDPGTKYCPFGMLNWRYTSSKGIRQTADGRTELADTPAPELNQATTKRIGRFRLTPEGQLTGAVAIVYMGQEALKRRIEASRTDTAGREKMLVDELKEVFSTDAEITLAKQPSWDDYEKPLIVDYRVTSPGLTSAGKRALIPLNIFHYNQKPLFPHASRQQNVLFPYLSRAVDEVHVVLPAQFAVESLPPPQTVDLPYAMYRSSSKQQNNEVVESREIVNAALGLSPEQYAEIKGFFDKVKEGDDQQGVLRSVLSVTGN